ncbi:hypothetical protein [Ahniella affigens]|nr:hypothetical protein [Ahniella affigens]
MIVPRFWSESVVEGRVKGRAVRIRRFGWSNDSEQAATAHAASRAEEALLRLQQGERVARREIKQSYGGGDGLPIREQIVDERDDVVITRNSYGARCLNTPDVLFVDMDFDASNSLVANVFGAASVIASISVLFALQFSPTAWFMALLLLPMGFLFAARFRAKKRAADSALPRLRAMCQRWLDQDPKRRLRLYRTPAGLRAVVMHQTFPPDSPAVRECFQGLGADPVYQRMCELQQCFRARVTAKPWRMGFTMRFRPRPGVWPIAATAMPIREQWVTAYEQQAREFAACHFLEELGSGHADFKVQRVVAWHDELCGALSGRPLA